MNVGVSSHDDFEGEYTEYDYTYEDPEWEPGIRCFIGERGGLCMTLTPSYFIISGLLP